MRIVADSPDYTLEGIVADDADLDGQFEMFTDDGETLMVNGWMFIIETLDKGDRSMKLKEHYIGFEVWGRLGFDRVRFAIMQTVGCTAGGIITRWEDDTPIFSISVTGTIAAGEWRLPLVAAESAAMAFDKYRIIQEGGQSGPRRWCDLPSYTLSRSEFAERKSMAGI